MLVRGKCVCTVEVDFCFVENRVHFQQHLLSNIDDLKREFGKEFENLIREKIEEEIDRDNEKVTVTAQNVELSVRGV